MLRAALLLVHIYVIHACEKYQYGQENDVELKDHVITTMTTPYVEICWDKCVWIMNCFSINVRNNSFGTIDCDLNNSSKRARPGSMVSRQGSQYHEIADWKGCEKHECRIKDDLSGGWYRINEAAVKIINEYKTWMDARFHCQSLGGDLLSTSMFYENIFVNEVLVKSSINKKKELLPGLLKHLSLDGSDKDVTLMGDPGAARYEIIDGEKTLYLSGHRSYAEVPAVVFNPEGFTFMIWVKPANQSKAADTIFADWMFPHVFLLNFHRNYRGLYFWLRTEDGNQVSTYYLSFEFNVWTHIAVSWNNTEKAVTIALNGIEKQKTSGSYLTSDIKRTVHTKQQLGTTTNANPEKTFHGHMKHLMVFDKTLSIEEIQTAMNYKDQGHWIGLNALNNSKTFKWSDGSDTHFTALTPHQQNPSSSNYKCVAFGNNIKWFERLCNETKSFICEKPFP